jgi:hypothetical protein
MGVSLLFEREGSAIVCYYLFFVLSTFVFLFRKFLDQRDFMTSLECLFLVLMSPRNVFYNSEQL